MRDLRRLALGWALFLFVGACGGDDTQPANDNNSDGAAGGGVTTSSGGAAGTSAAGGSGGGGSMSTGGGGSVSAGGVGASAGGGGNGGSSTGGNAGANDSGVADGGTGPGTIYATARKPTGIAINASTVYWADESMNSIWSCPKTGCGAAAPILVVSTPAPRGIALRGTTLYWITTGDADAGAAPTIKKCTLGACAANQVVDLEMGRGNGPFGNVAIAVDDQKVYAAGGPYLQTCPVAGCGDAGFGQFGVVFTGPLFGVALDTTTAFFGRAFGGLDGCPLSGCSSPEDHTRLVDTPTQTMAVAVDTTNVYWSEHSVFSVDKLDGAIRTCAKTGCTLASAKVLAAGSIFPYAMAVDDASLYFTDYKNGRVERITKTDFAHTCSAFHLSNCEACSGQILCNGTCSDSCNEAGTD
jgi:hypothetical protein